MTQITIENLKAAGWLETDKEERVFQLYMKKTLLESQYLDHEYDELILFVTKEFGSETIVLALPNFGVQLLLKVNTIEDLTKLEEAILGISTWE